MKHHLTASIADPALLNAALSQFMQQYSGDIVRMVQAKMADGDGKSNQK
jgi:hypothetical protein